MVNDAIRKIENGVSVITTKLGNKINGMTAAWISRVSFNPPMVMVSIGKTRFSHELIKKSRIFAVNVLGKKQIDIGKLFGLKSGKNFGKFKDIKYETKTTGSPILNDCIAYLDCKVADECDAGDHTIFVGLVVDGKVISDEEPVIYNHADFW